MSLTGLSILARVCNFAYCSAMQSSIGTVKTVTKVFASGCVHALTLSPDFYCLVLQAADKSPLSFFTICF